MRGLDRKGALLIGAVLDQRPELFGAALPEDPAQFETLRGRPVGVPGPGAGDVRAGNQDDPEVRRRRVAGALP